MYPRAVSYTHLDVYKRQVDGFTNLVGAQFSINYDSLVLSVNSVSNLNTTLNLSPVPGNNFNFPGTGTTKKGQLTFSWSDGNLAAKTLPNGTRMFSVVFNVLGGVGTRSDVSMTCLLYTSNGMRNYPDT